MSTTGGQVLAVLLRDRLIARGLLLHWWWYWTSITARVSGCGLLLRLLDAVVATTAEAEPYEQTEDDGDDAYPSADTADGSCCKASTGVITIVGAAAARSRERGSRTGRRRIGGGVGGSVGTISRESAADGANVEVVEVLHAFIVRKLCLAVV